MNRITFCRRPQTGKRRAGVRLELELLESRTVPSANINTDSAWDGGAEANPHNETTIAVNTTNTLNMIGSANDYQVRVNDGGQIHFIGLNRAHVTFDGGNTWMEYVVPFQGYNQTSDPAVSFDADGTAYFSNLAYVSSQNLTGNGNQPDIVVNHSTDGGKSWSAAVRVAAGVGASSANSTTNATINDKEYIVAWGHGNAMVTWSAFHLGPTGDYIDAPIYASVTHDGGNTWTDPVPITPSDIGNPQIGDQTCVPTVAADGSIYVGFERYNVAQVLPGAVIFPASRNHYMVVKVDPATGQPLGSPHEVSLVYDGPNDYAINVNGEQTYQDSEFRSWAAGNITADPTNAQHLAIVWSDMRNNPYPEATLPSTDPYAVKTNSDIIVSQSFDGGQNWSSATVLKAAGDQFQPWAAYNSSGLLQIGYFDRSYDPANHQYGYTLASEKKAGSLKFTFQEVTTALSDPTQGDAYGFVVTANPKFPKATTFLGDYSGIAVVPGTNQVAALWTDMRLQSSRLPPVDGWSEDAFFALVDPPTGASAGNGPSLISPAAAATGPDALLSSDASWKGLAVDAYFMDFARTNQTTSGDTMAELAKMQPTFASVAGLARAKVTPNGHVLAPADDLLESLFAGDSLFPDDLAAI